MFKNIPKGFERMDLVLTLNRKASDVLEKKVLHYIVRDFYILYAKEELEYLRKPKSKQRYYRFYFYAMPKDAQQVAYRIGINLQCLRPFYDKKHILLAYHTVPQPFPESIQIDIKAIKTEDVLKSQKI